MNLSEMELEIQEIDLARARLQRWGCGLVGSNRAPVETMARELLSVVQTVVGYSCTQGCADKPGSPVLCATCWTRQVMGVPNESPRPKASGR